MILSRRGFLSGLGAALAAPAIVKVASLMPIKAPPLVYYTPLTSEIIPWTNVEYGLGFVITQEELNAEIDAASLDLLLYGQTFSKVMPNLLYAPESIEREARSAWAGRHIPLSQIMESP